MPTGPSSEVYQRSWIESANDVSVGFPLASLPYCAFIAADGTTCLGVGIGNFVLDLRAVAEAGLLVTAHAALKLAFCASSLNRLMELGCAMWSTLRTELTSLLCEDVKSSTREALGPMLRAADDLRFVLPVNVTDYTDFYASREHAFNVGKLFRPSQPLLPNYDWVPIGYHGRASSVVISGTNVRRPHGQQLSRGSSTPAFSPTVQLDYECEIAAYTGEGNELGDPINIAHADDHIFGYSLLNDWSARDIQSWEYQPLGPFLGKNFATSVSPWVVPAAALKPYRVKSRARIDEPEPLAYLAEPHDAQSALDMRIEVWITTRKMRDRAEEPFRLSSANALNLYWSFSQMLTHHTSNGCNMRPGSLIASGTVSGGERGSEGCLLEMTKRGAEPIALPNGERRGFLEDGDEIILCGYCEREGLARVSFGECRGMVLPAHAT